MPMYEYQCRCGHTFSQLRSMQDVMPVACPTCQKTETVTQLISRSAFNLKGGGWYDAGYEKKESSTPADKGGSTKPADHSDACDAKSVSVKEGAKATQPTPAKDVSSKEK